ncbi:hypothetical protein BLA29_012033, partial [Euroglyphus maynei]
MLCFKSIALTLIVMVVAGSSITLAASIPDDYNMPDCNQAYVCGRNSTYRRLVCIEMKQFCDGKTDCPMGDDENNSICQSTNQLRQLLKNDEGIENDFSGTGFMFSVNNLIIDGGSNVK